MRFFALAVATALLVSGSAAAQSSGGGAPGAPVRIDCPSPRLEAKVSADLADGWSGPTDVGRLRRTRVREQAGRLYLECGYEMFGSLVFFRIEQPPTARACQAVADGFDCEGRRPVRPRRRFEDGGLTLRRDDRFDLDAPFRTTGAPDLRLEAREALKLFLEAEEGARIALMGRAAPTRRVCAEARLGRPRIGLGALDRGVYLCVETSDGRLARLLVTDRKRRLFGRGSVAFDFRVWRRPRR